jgi:DNA-directed RNA polymerase sigma subunit (sigma70/sigma32)
MNDELPTITQPPRGVCLTQQEVADLLGISQMRVYQIELAALAKIRRWFPELAEEMTGHPDPAA